MIEGKRVLAIIPARGGSKGIPRKNIIDLAGKPLIAWSIIEAKKSIFIDHLIVSSEDEEIIKVANEWGADVPFVRPAELARDDTPAVEPVIHAIEALPGYDYVVLLQPTSPMRTAEDIDGAIRLLIERDANLCVSVCNAEESPWWMYTLGDDGRLAPLMADSDRFARRQDLPSVYMYNGAVYVARCEWLLRERSLTLNPLAYKMPLERSVDIDGPLDLAFASLLLSQRNG